MRADIVTYWKTGGTGLREAAEQALLGGEDGIRKFLQDAESIQNIDNRIETARLAMTSGPYVREAAVSALQTTPVELEEFLLFGYQEPQDLDNKIETARVTTAGGTYVHEAGETALKGTSEDRELFLSEGQYTALQRDNRIETAYLATNGTANVKAAATVALRGTPEDIAEFLDIGQFTARARDLEQTNIEELLKQAKESGKQAAAATKQAEEASTKSIEASKLAKEAALKAASEAESAKDDAKLAGVKARQAAEAAKAAAESAQVAIGAADAANAAARRAALAAAQTASAASKAATAADEAHKKAIAAGKNEQNAADARKAAVGARKAADAAEESGVAAARAGDASKAAGQAAINAKGAATNARAAADAAIKANDYADAAGAHSDEARNAASEARRHADAADRAANRAAELANRSATAAYAARDAADSAAGYARKAADYADDAADHAGDAATYAATAKKNADQAVISADAATTAVNQARDIYALARETETAELDTRTDAAIEQARSMRTTSEAAIRDSAIAASEARSLEQTWAELAQEAADPDVDMQATAVKGRELAMQAMKQLGPWHQDAAARALSGTDQDVLDYLRTRWKEADYNDIRQQVVNLSTQSPFDSVRSAATAALAGSQEQIEAFYNTGQYDAGSTDTRIEVAHLATVGGTYVSEAAKAALADGTPKELAAFLQAGQYGKQLQDERILTAQLATEGGPELKAAATVALAGPAELIHEFVTVGQYMAQRKDDLSTTHNHHLQGLLAEGSMIAAKAHEDAWRAVEAAAEAINATQEADNASAEAQKSAKLATDHAADADASADAAENSAAKAAVSATTARNAANRADADAEAAEDSAANAAFSAAYARESAKRADRAKEEAHASAIAAGKSEVEAEAEAKGAWQRVRKLAEEELKEAQRQAEADRKKQEGPRKKRCVPGRYFPAPCELPIFRWIYDTTQPGTTSHSLVWEITGLADIEKCIANPATTECAVAATGLLPWGKLKLLGKIDEGVEALQDGRKTRRAVSCLTGVAHSFPLGTMVLMGDGTRRTIEDIRAGDVVTATNPVSGETSGRSVTRTVHTPDDRNFTDVTLTDGSTLTSTSHHLYWSEGVHEWKEASALRAGDVLRTAQNNRAVISDTHDWEGLQDAYDLTVDDLHTYYVSTSGSSVLVHNTDEGCPAWVDSIFDEIEDEWVTTGVIRDAKGNRIPNLPDRVVSQDDEVSKALTSYLKEIGYGSPNQTEFFGATHAETKLAFKMGQQDVENATVVINNNGGVCTGRDSCSKLVKAILPKGSKLNVYHPGSRKATEFIGEGPERP
ncbi:polymorphic toxin-type HINT domain-containing protein (plasmid) [Streptomyces sp. NBC_01220]|uniref:DddA-like double-stranded DNA deaminase toxin n=1 Tax=Streptomyces sp. NBC_01220 TaxID=2903781 RepID=UPI00352E2A15|nr:polymorphic toxin-type HINT domain-containing protein [Streptomyces sp. NBC_01220]